MELGGENDRNASVEMLMAGYSSFGIMAEDMVSSYLSVKVVSFFPGLLEEPCSNVMLVHVIDNVFQFR